MMQGLWVPGGEDGRPFTGPVREGKVSCPSSQELKCSKNRRKGQPMLWRQGAFLTEREWNEKALQVRGGNSQYSVKGYIHGKLNITTETLAPSTANLRVSNRRIWMGE